MQVFWSVLVVAFCSGAAQPLSCSEADVDAQVLILGGGMAGVSAANTLAGLGITDFVILEAQDRLGGRLDTVEIVPGVSVNSAANWIQGVDPAQPRLHPLFDLAERCGGVEGIYSNFDNIITYDSQGNEVGDEALRYADFDAATEAAIEYSSGLQNDISVREGLTQASWIPNSPEDNFVEWFGHDFCFSERPNVSSVTNLDVLTYSDFLADSDNDGEDYYITDSRGSPALIQCMTSNFSTSPSTDERIHLEAVVTRIEYGDDCVCATANENGQVTRYCAPYAIVTFSLGVLQQGVSTLFSPPLPEAKANALNLNAMAFYYIIYTVFDERFWDDYEYIGHVHPERGYFPVIVNVPPAYGVNATAMHVNEEVAVRLAGLSEDDLRAEVTQVFRSIYGDSVPEPNRVVSRFFGSDPLFLGSYSNVRPGGKEAFSELTSPEGGMYLAGEATNRKYSGFMHGAYLSGIETANAINERIVSSGQMVMGNIALFLVVSSSAILFL